jgi:putative membrane protein
MVSILALASVVVVALLHLGFMVLETTQWNTPLGRKLTHLSEEAARETAGVGINMGIYNGFLGAALLWVTFALGVREAYTAQWLLLTFIVFAGVVGAVTMRNRGIVVFQSLPALVALLFIWANHS